MARNSSEEQTLQIEKEILEACRTVHPEALRSWEAHSLWSRVMAITGDERPYGLGGQQTLYEALDRLSGRGYITVDRGLGGMFGARITHKGISELEHMTDS